MQWTEPTNARWFDKANASTRETGWRHLPLSAKFNLGDGGKRRRLQDMASLYGITPQRACQIVKAALDKLQKAIAA